MAEEPDEIIDSQAPHGDGSTFPPRSCYDCHRRKVKCSKVRPCGNCVRLGVECTFPPPGRKPRKISKKPKKADLFSRLSFLEQQVKKLGASNVVFVPSKSHLEGLVDQQSSDRNHSSESSPAERHPSDLERRNAQTAQTQNETHNEERGAASSPSATNSLTHQFGQLFMDRNSGQSQYVSNDVLADLSSQIKELRGLSESVPSPNPSLSSDEDPLSPTLTPSSDNSNLFLFGYYAQAHSLRSYHPTPTDAYVLLDIFAQNIAPLVSIIHKAALRNLIHTACTAPEQLDRGSEALTFAVYFAALSSITPEQCQTYFSTDHAILVQRYRFAVEQALSRAGFMNTKKLIVVQAAVLFLACACHPKDGRLVWTMIGLITRLGLGLGLHRDGSHFGLSPFETEMRRRLWWYIYLLDVQASEYQATSPQIREGDYDTQLPSNLNDSDWYPDLEKPPQERIGFTDMTLTLVRCRILMAHCKLMQMKNSTEGDQALLFKNRNGAIDELRTTLDLQYLQHCDVQIPIHWVVATIARVAVSRLWLVSHFSLLNSPGFDPNLLPDQCDILVRTAIEVLEFVYLLETHPKTKQWTWLFQGHAQWQSFAFVLSELCARPTSPLSGRAWAAVMKVFERWKQLGYEKEGLIMRLLERLMNRAASIRDQVRALTVPLVLEFNPPSSSNVDLPANLETEYPTSVASPNTNGLDIFRDVLSNVDLYQWGLK
ncbi:hypothetical protein KXV52_006442 [Aspergillus fumigatus]|nr:hypothetical protein KXV66_002269 [Aspergillus fumigatus]KAH3006295.1 hypothetical protein KXV73_009232 [Aspergillus fumigatus]KAH3357179.1 hypothetical protein KXV52_006442 [Aspergillus fumigatus]KAH3406512.1 hypothetical protein KXV40_001979 [Aspergillus fumigatus]